MTKCMLQVTGQDVKDACGTKQIDGGVKTGIEGRIHAMHVLWQEHSKEEDWGLLLIDARNAFNEDNWTAMLWDVRNEWASGGSS